MCICVIGRTRDTDTDSPKPTTKTMRVIISLASKSPQHTDRHRNTHADTEIHTQTHALQVKSAFLSDILWCLTWRNAFLSVYCALRVSHLRLVICVWVYVCVCVCVSVRLSDLSLHFWLCLIIACPHRMTKKIQFSMVYVTI